MIMATVGVLGILILLVLIAAPVVGIILILTSRRGGLGYPACGSCNYDLSGTIGKGTRCPECGTDIAVAGIVPPKGRRDVGRTWVGVAFVVVPLTCAGVALLGMSVRTVRSVRSQQAAQAAATQAAATNAQLKSEADTLQKERTDAAADLERLRVQLESMKSRGEGDAA